MTATISISKSAMFELIMAGLEAYAVKHQASKKISIETGAHLWGSINKNHPFKCTINHLSVETSANRKPSSVSFSQKSLLIKKDIAKVFGEQYQYIGTAHSHPYSRQEVSNAAQIRALKFYQLSSADHNCEIGYPEIEVSGRSYSVALILTLHSMLKANDRKDGQCFGEPLIEFSLGNIKCWLYGRVFQHKTKASLSDEERDSFERYGMSLANFSADEILPIPQHTMLESNIALDTICADFGRLKFIDNDSEYELASVAESRW
ncbi:hypothetical protein [Vibrio lentus]|uniref:JAB domain-containing protein n=1 Tax=Vibrio lentus TaxID=136468 RepID=A0AA45A8Y4_9VIBR|nr:hypothetical protein [Vibrio lentus]MCB5358198.1 hypothetical protein [Vibrio lentus]MCB5448667.1 hypothetical protein [Vibrio lentus]MCB5460554.1 hypothetical protein [Vibrio lentus]MCC4795961.1 hypothetical protein [Vibrio lentus]MCC4853695.1 hypothetical protein [Vibrio lentus]